VLISAAALAFGGALRGSFHFDDYSLLANPLITTIPGLWRMWGPLQTRPLTNLTFWLNYQLNGANPGGYHAVNVLFHIGAVLLLYLALKHVLQESPAFWAAAIFAVHPIQSEAVAYVFARSTLLSTVFCLASLLLWFRGSRAWAVALFALALLAKEECVAFPLFLLLMSIWRKEDISTYGLPITAMLVLALFAGARAAWATAYTVGSGAGFTAGISPLSYMAVQGAAIFRYLRLLIIPWGFTIEPTAAPPYALAWAAVLTIAAIAVWAFRKHHSAAVWVLCGLILLAPSSTIFPAADLAADRRMYLPMIAFSAAFGVIAPYLLAQIPWAIATVFLLLSMVRTEVWRTEETLWREAAQRAPGHVRPLLQLSRMVGDNEAADLLAEAQSLEPNNSTIPAELGRLYLKTGRYALALQEFGRALALSPRDANALNNRGAALLALKQQQAARHDFTEALQIDPCLAAARRNLQGLGTSTLPPCPATAK